MSIHPIPDAPAAPGGFDFASECTCEGRLCLRELRDGFRLPADLCAAGRRVLRELIDSVLDDGPAAGPAPIASDPWQPPAPCPPCVCGKPLELRRQWGPDANQAGSLKWLHADGSGCGYGAPSPRVSRDGAS